MKLTINNLVLLLIATVCVSLFTISVVSVPGTELLLHILKNTSMAGSVFMMLVLIAMILYMDLGKYKLLFSVWFYYQVLSFILMYISYSKSDISSMSTYINSVSEYYVRMETIFYYVPIFVILKKLWYIIYPIAVLLALYLILGKPIDMASISLLIYIVLIFRERGINRRYFLSILKKFISIIVTGILLFMYYTFVRVRYSDIINDYIGDAMMVSEVTNAMILSMYMIVLTLIIIMIYTRLLKIDVKFMNKLTNMIVVLLLTVQLTMIFSDYLIVFLSTYQVELFFIYITAATAMLFLSIFITRKLGIIRKSPFNRKSVLALLLNESYSYTDIKEYTHYFIRFMKSYNRKYQVAFYGRDFTAGELFKDLDKKMLEELLLSLPKEREYLNVDVEILNGTPLSRDLTPFDQKKKNMPRLLLPIRDEDDNYYGAVVIGKIPGAYCDEQLARILSDLFNVFKGFYLNMVNQKELRDKSLDLVKEREQSEFNKKLVQITEEKNAVLKERQERIQESIDYASLIQRSILPQQNDLAKVFNDYFILWKPRDVVGGDFYWLHNIEETGETLFAVIDCTGHGVPGALISMSVYSLLNNIVRDRNIIEPAEILNNIHRDIGLALHQESGHTQQDGLDISLIKINKEKKILTFAGAALHLIYYDGVEPYLRHIRGSKHSIGGMKWQKQIAFEQVDLPYSANAILYLYSDGIIDQPRIDKERLVRFGHPNWLELLSGIYTEPLSVQHQIMEEKLNELLSYHEQRDDITIVAIKA